MTEIGLFRGGLWVQDKISSNTWECAGIDGIFSFGNHVDTPVTGDWNSDGFTEIGLFHEGLGTIDMNGKNAWDGMEVDRIFSFGFKGDLPVTGNWNINTP